MRGDGACKRCPADTYSLGPTRDECTACPFGTTSAPGASSIEQCREVAQLCPVGQTAPKDAVSQKECGCYRGYGSGSGDPNAPCTLCPPGTFSSGGDLEACKPCRFGYTSPAGSTSVTQCVPVDVCPAGTELPEEFIGASTNDCRCKHGYGSSTGAAPCHLCPVGTFSEGGSFEDCKPCPFGYTSEFGATSREECHPVAQTCPVGQIAPPGAVSREQCGCIPGFGGGKTPSDSCGLCPAGSFASGGDTQPCQPCRFGYTSPVGSTSEAQCYPTNACPAGTELREGLEDAASVSDCVCKAGFGSLSGTGACHLCPAGTYSFGGSMEECRPCPFGTTSAAGAPGKDHCLTSPQACPIGQWAPEGAVSKDQCVCYPGHGAGDSPTDPCRICKPGSFASGDALDRCMPCGFGYTSPEGSTSEHDCRPINQCPAGTAIFGEDPADDEETPVSAESCQCKPGHGSSTGTAPCHLCPSGTFATGGTLEDCIPCPFGFTTAPGATTISACMKVAQECPAGQIAPSDAVSADLCSCLAGFGGGATPKDPCRRCPAGTFSPGGTTEPCTPCGFGYTSPEGSTSRDACYPSNACPVGTEVHRELHRADSLASCVCKPGFGAVPGKGFCKLCPKDTYAYGGDWDECEFCPFGTTSAPGAKGKEECVPVTQPCPIGQIAPPGAVSADNCGCLPGFGGGDKPTDACTICPTGSWSPGGSTDRCVPCGFGYTSPAGSLDMADCYAVDMCPAGTEYRDSAAAFSLSDCVCKNGHGSQTGSGICRICPAGTFSPGGTMEDCKPCGFGYTSPEGSESFMDCRPVAQRCPIGQSAPEDAASVEECRCYNGFGGGLKPSDPCAMCTAGYFSPNKGTERCIPCPEGYTSLSGSDSVTACQRDDTCPPGTEEVVGYDGLKSCKCKAGYGSLTGTGACRLCPVATYSLGGTMEDCKPCPFGHTSRAGADTPDECQRIAQPCPIGQIAPPFAVSADQCACMPGFGGGEKPTDVCTICPPGSWSPGGTTQRCISCGFGYTSAEGSSTEDACVEMNACPIGSIYQDGVEKAFSIKDCVCRPGYGVHEDGFCRLCKPGTYAEGGTMDLCKSCGVGWLSEEGSVSWHDCFQEIDVPYKLAGPGTGQGRGHDAMTEKVAARRPIGASLQQVAQNGTAVAAQKAVRRRAK